MKLFKNTVYTLLLVMILSVVSPNIIQIPGYVNSVEAATKISKGKATLIKGQTTTLKISGTKKKAKWSSSKKSVATVSSKGKVTAKKKGTATITAKIGNKKYTCKVTVQTPKISSSKITLSVGETSKLKVNGTDQKITWKSSNKKIATVDKNGKVTGKKAGSVKITATVLNKKYSCTVTVKAKQCKLNAKELDLQVDQLGFLELQGAKGNVTWKSSNPSIVKVSNGVVLAVKNGKAKITATYQKKKYTCNVTVKKKFSEKEALKKLSISKKEQEDLIAFKIKNNYIHGMSVYVEVLFYDKSGNIIEIQEDSSQYLNIGKETMLVIWKPFSYDDKIVDYSYYECKWSVENAYLSNNVKEISCSYNFGNNNIILEIKNKSDYEVQSEITMIMYYNGEIVGNYSRSIFFDPKQVIYDEIDYPYSRYTYEDIKPDKIEIYIS